MTGKDQRRGDTRQPDRAEAHCGGRRRIVAALFAGIVAPMVPARVFANAGPRQLSFQNLHTGEQLAVEYHDGHDYLSDACTEINWLLRDHRADEAYGMDTGLLDMLHELASATGGSRFEVISGYRSPATNASLRKQSNGVAKRSLHMQGRAIDVRLGGVDTRHLRDAAVHLRAGGVGYYAKSNFIHVDTGRFRTW